MLDEEKIRLMTQISIYEKEQEHDELVLSHYFREDYVRYGCLRTLVVATLTYWSVVAMYILYRFQELLREINTMDYFDIIGKLMFGYLGFAVILYIYAFVVYHIRFQLAKKGLIRYNRNLKRFLKWEERHASRQEIETGIVQVKDGIGGEELGQIEYNITNRAGKKSIFERKKAGEGYEDPDMEEADDSTEVSSVKESFEKENAESGNSGAEGNETEKNESGNAGADITATDSNETDKTESDNTGTESSNAENTESGNAGAEDDATGNTETESDTDKNEETENNEEPAHASLEDEGRL
ncbi:MAG: hypothetical protein J6O53_02225 [Eubacterium sp.]|nr:hypothetical protein [Eubacterium sp.]